MKWINISHCCCILRDSTPCRLTYRPLAVVSKSPQALAIYFLKYILVAFGVEIHLAACISCGVMRDHPMGIVIGKTAVVEDDVSILQFGTLGETGKTSGDRYPKISEGVMIGASATILNNIEVGRGGESAVILLSCARYHPILPAPASDGIYCLVQA